MTLEINEAVVAAASWQGYNGHTAVQGHAGHGGHPLHGTGNGEHSVCTLFESIPAIP